MCASLIEGEFNDADNQVVEFALDLDVDGQAFELDLWRVDFEPLQELPNSIEQIRVHT